MYCKFYQNQRKIQISNKHQAEIKLRELIKIKAEADEIAEICRNASQNFKKIEDEFVGKAKLTKKDLPFLFFAVALQTLRWVLLPKMDFDFSQISKNDRLNSNEIKKFGPLTGKKSGQLYEKTEINNIFRNNKTKFINELSEYQQKTDGFGKYKYLSWIEILTHAVPYDVMSGSEKIHIVHKWFGKTSFESPVGIALNGKNHRIVTLGHDPVLGWLFGTLNIMSGTVTFCDFQTFNVNQSVKLNNWTQSIDYMNPANLSSIFVYCINSIIEDSKRLPAAIARQAMHIQSDKYTKDGLPIPLLTITPSIAQNLINRGWNSYEAERVLTKALKNIGTAGIQFVVAETINLLIKSIYLFSSKDDIDIMNTKIERILTTSACITESSNIIAAMVTKNAALLDIGGIISMVKQIATDVNSRNEIIMEYMRKRLYDTVMEV